MHLWIGVLLIFGILTRAINAETVHFTLSHFSESFITAIPGLVIVWMVGVVLREKAPRWGLLLTSFSQSFLFIIVVDYALSGVITTPFPLVDHMLIQWDKQLGFSTLALLNWTYHQNYWFAEGLHFCYNTWFLELILTPLFLALFRSTYEIDHYMVATFMSLVIGALIYYFWPTIAPAGILQSPYFSNSQHELVQRFQEIHQSKPITVFGGGMIAFPSFHVINNILVTYAWRKHLWIFLPILIIDMFSIFATLALGYHYLVDVIAGFFLAIIVIFLSELLLKNKIGDGRCCNNADQVCE